MCSDARESGYAVHQAVVGPELKDCVSLAMRWSERWRFRWTTEKPRDRVVMPPVSSDALKQEGEPIVLEEDLLILDRPESSEFFSLDPSFPGIPPLITEARHWQLVQCKP